MNLPANEIIFPNNKIGDYEFVTKLTSCQSKSLADQTTRRYAAIVREYQKSLEEVLRFEGEGLEIDLKEFDEFIINDFSKFKNFNRSLE